MGPRPLAPSCSQLNPSPPVPDESNIVHTRTPHATWGRANASSLLPKKEGRRHCVGQDPVQDGEAWARADGCDSTERLNGPNQPHWCIHSSSSTRSRCRDDLTLKSTFRPRIGSLPLWCPELPPTPSCPPRCPASPSPPIPLTCHIHEAHCHLCPAW